GADAYRRVPRLTGHLPDLRDAAGQHKRGHSRALPAPRHRRRLRHRPLPVRLGRLGDAVRPAHRDRQREHRAVGQPDQPVPPRGRGTALAVRPRPGCGLSRRRRRPGRRARCARADRGVGRRPDPAIPEGCLGMTAQAVQTQTPPVNDRAAVIELRQVSRWYGNVVAVNDVTMTIGPGVTGLLGPNGAGKSTLIALMSGFLAPSTGTVTLDGDPLWRNEQVYRQVGLVPEREALFEYLTGRQFVVANAELHGLPDPGAAAQRAIALVEMTDAQDRAISTYSKGMRQRIKMASSLVHDPSVLLLDEPFNGMDPRQR